MKAPFVTALVAALSLGTVLSLGACTGNATDAESGAGADESANNAAAPAPARRASAPAAKPVCNECGTVTSIEPIKMKGEGSGAGAIGGAVLGGVAGNQVGGGSGKKIATVIGAIGGGYAGHKAEEQIRSTTVHRVTIRMENGGTQTVNLANANHLSVGQQVAVYGDTVSVRD